MKISPLNTALIIIFALLFIYVFIKPSIYILKVILRGGIWSAVVYGINIITAAAGFTVGINPATSLLYGVLGIYGVALNYIIKMIYRT